MESKPPVIVSYGMGLDSTAMLVEMWNRGYDAPDLILFSDTGGEKPETYAYLEVINGWLRSKGWPEVTVVKYVPTRAPYTTLEGKSYHNESLPSLAYGAGKHSCAQVFKAEVMEKWIKRWEPAKQAFARGQRVMKYIGYDASPPDLKRKAKADKSVAKMRAEGKKWEPKHMDYRAPIQEWGYTRDRLAEIIRAAGLPVPAKSACFICPASQLDEVFQLKMKHPDLYARAAAMEDRARDGKHGFTAPWLKGLGLGGWAWGWISQADTLDEAIKAVSDKGGRIKVALRP